eukprot:gene139-5507_t
MSSPPLELGQGGSPHLWREEIIVIFSLAIPTIAQTASQQLMLTTDQIFLGHIGTLELAAAALGLTFSNIQLFFLMGAISLSFGKLVAGTLFGQEKVVSNLVGVYCRGLIPGLIPMMLSLVLMKYLQSQNEVIAPAAATIITFFLNILFNFAFIAWFGFTGSALATSFARFCQFLMLCVAVLLFEAKRKASLGSTASKALGLDGDDEATSLLQADGSPSAVERKANLGSTASKAVGLGGDDIATSLLQADGSPSATKRKANLGSMASKALGLGGDDAATSPLQADGSPSATKRKANLGSTASKALGLDGDDAATSPLQADGSPSAVDSAAPEKESSQQTASDGTAAVLLMVPPSSTDSTNSTDSTKEYQGSVGLIRSLSSKGLSAMRRQLSWFPLPSSPAAAGGGGGDNGDGTSPWGAGTEGSGPSRKQSGVGAYIAGVWHTIVGETKLALQPHILMRFARLAVPGGVMMMFEAGSFEVTTVFASRLGPTVTAAHACMLAIIVLTYFSGPFAIGIAASIRVGNLVGAGKPELAKLSAKISVYIATFMMAIFGLIILLTRHHLGKIFTADPEVIAVFASIAPMA